MTRPPLVLERPLTRASRMMSSIASIAPGGLRTLRAGIRPHPFAPALDACRSLIAVAICGGIIYVLTQPAFDTFFGR